MIGVAGCHGLLDVTDPTWVQDKDIANANGANGKRVMAAWNVSQQLQGTYQDVGLFTDEQTWDLDSPPNPPYRNYYLDLDRRDGTAMVQYFSGQYHQRDDHLDNLDQMLSLFTGAIATMRSYGADSLKGEYLAQLFGLRAYLVLQIAEDICPGFPINDISAENLAVYSQPYSTDSAITEALAQADSALADGRDTTRFLNLARVVKGRALLDLGRWSEAGAAVTSVPTNFAYTTDPDNTNNYFLRWSPNGCCGGVGEREGGNGLPFVSAQDPRVPTTVLWPRQTDATDTLYDQTKYDGQTPLTLASGIEARLIQAEVALHTGDPGWIAILDSLRTTCTDATTCPSPPAGTGGVAGLAPLSAPSDAQAQLDLVFRERAFWLFFTGHRVGDMRRLIKNYDRAVSSVYAAGPYPILNMQYGTATAIGIPIDYIRRTHPNFTGCVADEPR